MKSGKNGKRYAAKVSQEYQSFKKQGPTEKTEYEIRKKLEQIKDKLPQKIKKHFVKTFYIQEKTNESSYIYISEILRPLSSYEERCSL